jgi:hypothetical protein
MLMICSSRARNRSLKPVVSCCFGRIASSDATTESRCRFEEIFKTKLQASVASAAKTLQSQNRLRAKIRLFFNGLQVVHGRLNRNSFARDVLVIAVTHL